MSTIALPGPFPIRVDPSFFFITVLLGARPNDPARTVAWVVIVFLSVLFHEFGHAVAARAFGYRPRIELHGMGGTTHWGDGHAVPSAGRRLVVSLAGPLTGLVIGIAFVFLTPILPLNSQPFLVHVVEDIVWVNAGWGVLNLLPMFPLDGGQALLAVLDAFTNGRGAKPTMVITILFSMLCVAGALSVGLYFGALLCAMFGWQAFQALRKPTNAQ